MLDSLFSACISHGQVKVATAVTLEDMHVCKSDLFKVIAMFFIICMS